MYPAPSVPAVILGLTAVALCLAPARLATAQWETPWETELAGQIEDELDCRVAFINEVIRRHVEDRISTVAKVHCEDQRSFDAYRSAEFEPFEFRACEAVNVEGC
jgi:hypothetical protein